MQYHVFDFCCFSCVTQPLSSLQTVSNCEVFFTMVIVNRRVMVAMFTAGGSSVSDVDGGWSSWTTWTVCSASCAGGTQWRQRTCSTPVPSGTGRDCAGPGHDSRPCNEQPCVGQWSCWSDLGPCSITCGPGGSRRRRRRCQRLPGVAISCHGNDTETLPCDGPLVPCPSPGKPGQLTGQRMHSE